ncbi:hypothetical protein BU26DRAFT_502493 [Trematosphaeria pertusa]|uniref:Uncharacterized protein n=1 Tax=Trematosphaeria pertusa TaxID=390896 RepID=A0A6A6ING4_9PLEO|nr:uncharacterized protein BU26DRAFT_502493 [Trematosphaeria pertusa]KAF2251926.1 hypothetical protein BU26DRAFT_502493 [Trematosphaeria pertusa]
MPVVPSCSAAIAAASHRRGIRSENIDFEGPMGAKEQDGCSATSRERLSICWRAFGRDSSPGQVALPLQMTSSRKHSMVKQSFCGTTQLAARYPLPANKTTSMKGWAQQALPFILDGLKALSTVGSHANC